MSKLWLSKMAVLINMMESNMLLKNPVNCFYAAFLDLDSALDDILSALLAPR